MCRLITSCASGIFWVSGITAQRWQGGVGAAHLEVAAAEVTYHEALKGPWWSHLKSIGFVWKCRVPLHPMVLLIIIPTKWLFHWGYTPFSDIPNLEFVSLPQVSKLNGYNGSMISSYDLLCYPQSSCEMPQFGSNSRHRGRDAAHWTKRSRVPGVCPASKIPGKLGVWCWKHLNRGFPWVFA